MPRLLNIDILPLAAWPMADQMAWSSASRDAGYFDEGGALAGCSAERRQILRSAYGRWLGYLQSIAPQDPRMASGLAALACRDVIGGFLQRLRSVATCTARAYVTDLLTVCRAMSPEDNFELLQAAARHLWRTAKPEQDKLSRMVPARELLKLGFELMAEANNASTSLKRASRYRDGLMIAMLVSAPVRLGNFIAIEIGRHLVRDEDGYRLRFAGSEVKNRRPLELRLLPELAGPIDTWLEIHRPECVCRKGRWHRDGAGSALWISEGGNRYCHGFRVRTRIERCTEARFGKPINPHLFRDIAATSVAIELPSEVGIVRSVLGHASPRTGERFYNQAGSVRAGRAYLEALDVFRSSAPEAL